MLLIEVLVEFSLQGASAPGFQSVSHTRFGDFFGLGKVMQERSGGDRERALSIFLSSLPNSLSKSQILIKCDLLGKELA